MSFTYNPATDLGQVRTEIGDTVLNDGILPNKVNFSNEEIEGYLSSEGDHVMRAVAHAFEVASRRWAIVPTESSLGPESRKRDTAGFFRAEAQRLRALYGYVPDEDVTPAIRPPAVSGMATVTVHQAAPVRGRVYR